MTGSTTEEFEEIFSKLPAKIQRRARKSLFIWLNNPSHPSLLFKKPFERQPFWSIRITRGYRALGYLKNGHIYWFWIGNHDDYERLLSRL
jgi:hypothetical protein